MKILNLYIGRNLVANTLLAVAILTFVMLSANLMRAFELLARGISLGLLLRFLLYLIPMTLTFTIPLSALAACVLVFSRLSADREVTAMRASGVSLWQIIAPGLLWSIALCGLCIYLQTDLSPRCRYRAEQLKRSESARNLVRVLEPESFVELPGYIVYVGSRRENVLENVHIFALDSDGRVKQDITARSGRVDILEDSGLMKLHLQDATIVSAAAGKEGGGPRRLAGTELTLPLDMNRAYNQRRLTRKPKYMDVSSLFASIHVFGERGIDVSPLYVELHKRFSLAMSPFAFLLLGIPFGIRTRRQETSVGLVISLVLALFFYMFLIFADGLKHYPAYHPELLVWVPNVLYQIGGLWGLIYLTRR